MARDLDAKDTDASRRELRMERGLVERDTDDEDDTGE